MNNGNKNNIENKNYQIIKIKIKIIKENNIPH